MSFRQLSLKFDNSHSLLSKHLKTSQKHLKNISKHPNTSTPQNTPTPLRAHQEGPAPKGRGQQPEHCAGTLRGGRGNLPGATAVLFCDFFDKESLGIRGVLQKTQLFHFCAKPFTKRYLVCFKKVNNFHSGREMKKITQCSKKIRRILADFVPELICLGAWN